MKTKKRTRLTKAERRSASGSPDCSRMRRRAPPGRWRRRRFITDPRLAPAYKFWNDHAEQLRDLGTLEYLDRFTFAMFCVYVAEFIAAEDDILASGYSVKVKTVSGDLMPRENPSVARRDHAAKMILEMSRLFGLSKIDRLNISKLARGSDLENTLFNHGSGHRRTRDRPSCRVGQRIE